MKVTDAHKRLGSLWGWIDAQHNRQIAAHIPPGAKVLDIGCGYGSLVNYLSTRGYQAEGIDLDAEAIAIAKQLFPQANVRAVNAEAALEYPTESFDAIVLRDSLHHLVWENDRAKVFQTIRRLLKADGPLIVFDPNPTLIVRLARKLMRHDDPEVTPEAAQAVLKNEQFTPQRPQYYEVIGLPLSGGYVGIQLVPNLKLLNAAVAGLNSGLSHLSNRLGLGRFLCWRYLIVARLAGK